MRLRVIIPSFLALSLTLLFLMAACGSPSNQTLAQAKSMLGTASIGGSIGLDLKHGLAYIYRESGSTYLFQDLSGDRAEEQRYSSVEEAVDAAAKKFGDGWCGCWAVPPLQESGASSGIASGSPGFDLSQAARVLESASIGHGIIVHSPAGDFTYTRVYPDADTGNKDFWAQASPDDPGIFFNGALEALQTLEHGMAGVGLTGFTAF